VTSHELTRALRLFDGAATLESTPSIDSTLADVVMGTVAELNPQASPSLLAGQIRALITRHRNDGRTHGAGGRTRTEWVVANEISPAFDDLTGSRWPNEATVVEAAATLGMSLVAAARAANFAPFQGVFDGSGVHPTTGISPGAAPMEVVQLPVWKAELFGHRTCLADGRHRLLALTGIGVPFVRALVSHLT
jgi:hypothetical protein